MDRINQQIFEILPDDTEWAFKLYDDSYGILFTVGDGPDICIMKENYKDKCHCKQLSFDYDENEAVLVGKEEKENPFTVKRVRVLQMK